MYAADGTLTGAEVVIDKDWATALLARELEADVLVLATDVDGVYVGWRTPDRRMIEETTPPELARMELPEGSMGSKVDAAISFVSQGGNLAVIGSLERIDALVAGTAGTRVRG